MKLRNREPGLWTEHLGHLCSWVESSELDANTFSKWGGVTGISVKSKGGRSRKEHRFHNSGERQRKKMIGNNNEEGNNILFKY